MYRVYGTKKLLDRVKVSLTLDDSPPTTMLGNWYATALFWKPQLALLVNERTLLPVLMPLAPAATLLERFPQQLGHNLVAHGIGLDFIVSELANLNEARFAKTANRSIVGIMNQFAYLAEGYRDYLETDDLLALSVKLSETPCSPLSKSAISPDRELKRLVGNWRVDDSGGN